MSRELMIPTTVAQERGDEHDFMGHGLFAELAGETTLTGLLTLAVTGRLPSGEELQVLDGVAGVMTVADPRVWPLKIGRLIASYGRYVPAVAAAQLCLQGGLIGPWACGAAAELLAELAAAADDAACPASVEAALRAQLQAGRHLVGLGVPIRAVDERVVALDRILARRGRDRLRHWRLLCVVDTASRRMADMPARSRGANIGAGTAAALLDLGYRPEQIGPLATALTSATFVANAWEGARQQQPLLQRLPDAVVDYAGPAARRSPRATK